MKKILVLCAVMFTGTVFGLSVSKQSNQPTQKKSLIDYNSFSALVKEVDSYRKSRQVSVEKFNKLSDQNGVLILDTRSKRAYTRKHLKNAVHLNFSDFTKDKLAKVIPSKNTAILIYCNNNFSGDRANFSDKGRRLALNIPTFINLYGYGYKNVYELYNRLSVNDKRLEFAGTDSGN